MKYRYIFLLAFLAVVPSSLRAQTNCSVTNFDQVVENADRSACQSTLKITTYPMSWVINAYCYQTQLGLSSTHYNPQTINLPATGACTTLDSVDCAASYTWNKVTPTAWTSTTYDQLNFQAMNGIYQFGTLPTCTTLKGATSTYQCQAMPCKGNLPPPPKCTVCYAPQVPNPECCSCPCTSPIILDITGDGYSLTDAAHGVMFDMSGDGKLWQIGWTAEGANNAFLALPGLDGLVHNGQQLFGNFTPQPPCSTGDNSCSNGFRALAVYDDPKNGGNGDGIIDARDAIFSALRLWVDANHDGISQPEELHTLPALGINSISLTYKESNKTDQYGNVFRYQARLNPDKPTDAGKTAYDVFFVVLPPTTTARGQICPVPGRVQPLPAIVKR
jgi:hypothetical protein